MGDIKMKTHLTTLDLPQIHRFAVGFDEIFDSLWRNSTATSTTGNYPPYNILKYSDTEYVIEIAVAGFIEKELDVEYVNNRIVVSGTKFHPAENGPEYLHQGISNRDFTKAFNLADSVEVKGAVFENGLLRIRLEKLIPEASKPKKIPIALAK